MTASAPTLFMNELQPRLREVAASGAQAYRHAQPFPHAVFDDLIPSDVLERALAEWPSAQDIDWLVFDDVNEKKAVCADVRELKPQLRDVLHELNSTIFVEFLERLTGISGLIADPSFAAAGISDVGAGGFLNPHSDFLFHKHTQLDRRINVLLYLNHGWTADNGGQFELWAGKPLRCVERIVPTFNRMVVFNTTGQAVHGHTQPVEIESGGSRKCISTYYFTRGRPLRELVFGPQEVLFDGVTKPSLMGRAKGLGRALVPAVVYDSARSARRRVRRT
jgi:hypothetical protein